MKVQSQFATYSKLGGQGKDMIKLNSHKIFLKKISHYLGIVQIKSKLA